MDILHRCDCVSSYSIREMDGMDMRTFKVTSQLDQVTLKEKVIPDNNDLPRTWYSTPEKAIEVFRENQQRKISILRSDMANYIDRKERRISALNWLSHSANQIKI